MYIEYPAVSVAVQAVTSAHLPAQIPRSSCLLAAAMRRPFLVSSGLLSSWDVVSGEPEGYSTIMLTPTVEALQLACKRAGTRGDLSTHIGMPEPASRIACYGSLPSSVSSLIDFRSCTS